MRLWFQALIALAVSFGTLAAETKTKVKLVLDSAAARPGDTIMAGVVLDMAPDWHTYWRYGGDSGEATKIKWKLPNGITAEAIQWPLPEKITQKVGSDSLVTYVYEKQAVLLVPLQLADTLAPGKVSIQADVSWLECQESCVPGEDQVAATLEIVAKGTPQRPSSDAGIIESWRKKLPLSSPPDSASIAWDKTLATDARTVLIEWKTDASIDPQTADFYPYGDKNFDVTNTTERVSAETGKVVLRKRITKYDGDWPAELGGMFVGKKADGSLAGFEARLVFAGAPAGQSGTGAGTTPVVVNGGGEKLTLVAALAFAFLGGLILNIMPCVLPVIALKILGFVSQGNSAPGTVRKLGLIYGLGVLVSFLLLAGVVIGLKAAGQAASWGVQLQNPIAVIVLMTLVLLVALNLFGVFEVVLGGGAMGKAHELASKEGPAGAFFNGVLATILATPCTAPFLSGAVGFAFTQPASLIVLIFLTVGAGLAMPYVALCWHPAWLKFLPKPGVWMEKFKQAMGFPMLATAVWLYTLATPQYHDGADFWIGVYLVIIALAAWVWGDFVQRGRKRKGLAMGVAAALVILAYGYVLERELHWRTPPAAVGVTNGVIKESEDGIEWHPWSPDAVAEARKEGRPILVDFTAKWCSTCQWNKRVAIEVPEVRAKIKEIKAIAFIENSYTKGKVVNDELARYQRAGVPLVLVYPRDRNQPPFVLPTLLSKSTVLEYLDKAAQ